MKVLVGLFGFLVILGCGDDEEVVEKPFPIEPEPKAEILPEPIDQPPAAEFFAPFKDTLTDTEFEFLLESVATHCSEDLTRSGAQLRWRLSKGLSEDALDRVYSKHDKIFTIQAAHLNQEDRIRVAAYFKYQPELFYGKNYLKDVHFEHDYVIYQFADVFGIFQLAGDKTKRHWYGEGEMSGDLQKYRDVPNTSYENLPDDLVPPEVKEVYTYVRDKWLLEGEMRYPLDANYCLVDDYLVIFDPEGEPFIPFSTAVIKYMGNAPQASDAEIALYNRIHTPYSYDCVEDY